MLKLLVVLFVTVGTQAIAKLTFDQMISDVGSVCNYRGAEVVSEFILSAENKVSRTFCFTDGECSLNGESLDYLFFCAAVNGACPKNPKFCYRDGIASGKIVSNKATISKVEDEALKDFASCKYQAPPRTGFFKVDNEKNSGWMNTCFARVSCTAKKNGEAPPLFVMCNGKAIVGTKDDPILECPQVNECTNKRILHGSKWLDVKLPDQRE